MEKRTGRKGPECLPKKGGTRMTHAQKVRITTHMTPEATHHDLADALLRVTAQVVAEATPVQRDIYVQAFLYLVASLAPAEPAVASVKEERP